MELQKTDYENYIKAQHGWIFAGVYADYGSRFSGNTVDMLQINRVLKEKGVIIWFEKENIRSTDRNIELAITIYAMLAQEEIRNISENTQWRVKVGLNRE